MERPNQLLPIPAVFLGLVFLINTQTTTASEWSYKIDHFSLTKFDAGFIQTDHQTDNFNNDTLSPWVVDNGTAEESGGTAILKNPGSLDDDWGELKTYHSEIENYESRFNVIGTPHAYATSRWLAPTVPSSNHFYEMGLSIDFSDGVFIGDKVASFSIGVINLDSSTAAAISSFLGTDVPTGLSGYFSRGIEDEEYDIEIVEYEFVAIPHDLKSALLMGLIYDEEIEEVTARFSFDETATDFGVGVVEWTPFGEYEIPQIADIVLSSEIDFTASTYVPIPAALPLFGSALGLFGLMGWKRNKSV